MEQGDVEILEFKRGEGSSKGRDATVLQQIVKLERRIFPKHESLAASLDLELSRKNSGLLFALARQHQNHDQQQQQQEDEICVAGYVIYTFTSSLAASIVKLAVKECYRMQGYGQSLLKAAILKCRTRPICRITLHVDPAREAAMALYRKMGFRTDTIVLDYYAPCRDAHRMFIEFDIP